MTRAELQAQLADLKAARASGVMKVRFGEREVTYRSDRELVAAIAALEAELAGKTPARSILVRTTKGY